MDTAIENLWNGLERGENTEMITERINARTAEKEKLLIELAKEENKRTVLSEAQIAAFLDYVLKLPEDDINKKRAIINIFVNAIYLYDDHLDIVFNASNQMMETKNIPIDDIEAAFNGCSNTLHKCSSINNVAPPGKRLETHWFQGVFFFAFWRAFSGFLTLFLTPYRQMTGGFFSRRVRYTSACFRSPGQPR